jgi:hypothetical protein
VDGWIIRLLQAHDLLDRCVHRLRVALVCLLKLLYGRETLGVAPSEVLNTRGADGVRDVASAVTWAATTPLTNGTSQIPHGSSTPTSSGANARLSSTINVLSPFILGSIIRVEGAMVGGPLTLIGTGYHEPGQISTRMKARPANATPATIDRITAPEASRGRAPRTPRDDDGVWRS